MMDCKGRVYRASVWEGKTKNGITSTRRLTMLKKKSCSGCSQCDWIDEALLEVREDWPILGLERIKDGELYKLGVTNKSYDFETGICDEFDLCVISVGCDY